jgi:hypothetical protein
MYYCQIMPVPFILLSAALQEAESQGYIFVAQTMITVEPQNRLMIPAPKAQPAFLIVFKSENTNPPDLSKIGLSAPKHG